MEDVFLIVAILDSIGASKRSGSFGKGSLVFHNGSSITGTSTSFRRRLLFFGAKSEAESAIVGSGGEAILAALALFALQIYSGFPEAARPESTPVRL
jgi:hypothetical protein